MIDHHVGHPRLQFSVTSGRPSLGLVIALDSAKNSKRNPESKPTHGATVRHQPASEKEIATGADDSRLFDSRIFMIPFDSFAMRFSLSSSVLLLACAALPFTTVADAAGPKSFVYKTVGKLDIEADVYLPTLSETSEGENKPLPVLVWIHGGALMLNSRASVPPQMIGLAKKDGFALVSIDYRLAPETKLDGIVRDVEDALNWVHDKGPELFRADPENVVVAGASAGGYLALMAGVTDNAPRPKAILSCWGYGDILGDWCTRPNPAFGKGEAPKREEAFAGIGDQPIVSTGKNDYAARSKLFFYMKRFGKWTEIVSGVDPLKEPEKLEVYCPRRRIGDDFPPLLMLHGTRDPDVPVEQSKEMHSAMLAAGHESELVLVEGGGHSLWGGDKKEIDAAFARSLEFVSFHLKSE